VYLVSRPWSDSSILVLLAYAAKPLAHPGPGDAIILGSCMTRRMLSGENGIHANAVSTGDPVNAWIATFIGAAETAVTKSTPGLSEPFGGGSFHSEV